MADKDDENGTSPWLQLAALRAERDSLRALLARALVLLPYDYEDERALRALIEAALEGRT